MQSSKSQNAFFVRYSFDRLVDFCIWILEQGGLQVPPFDAHPEGDGILRNVGVQAQQWKLWLVGATQQAESLSQHMVASPQQHASLTATDFSPSAWPGTTAVKNTLQTLWQQYQPLSSKRRKWEVPLAIQWRPVNDQLWHDLQVYQPRLPSLRIYLVEYPKQIGYPIWPASMIVTVVDGQLDNEAFRQLVLRTAEELATSQRS